MMVILIMEVAILQLNTYYISNTDVSQFVYNIYVCHRKPVL